MATSTDSVVAIAKFRAVLSAAEAAGLDVTHERTTVGLSSQDGPDVAGFLPDERYIELWDGLMRRLRDPALPLAAARVPVEEHGLIGFMVMTSGTVGEAMGRGIRYQRRWASRGHWEPPERIGDRLVLRWTPLSADSRLGVRVATEYAVASMVVGLRAISAVALVPRRVAFTHVAPSDTTAHASLFGIAPVFGEPCTELVFDATVLDLPLPKASPQLASYLERQCGELLEAAPPPAPTVARVRAVLLDAMDRGARVSAALVARELSMSHRTLLRRLADEGHSYRSVLDDVRREAMRQHRGSRLLPVAQLASVLGYSSLSAFHRARRRWRV